MAAAQPTFSDDELKALFAALGLSGDPRDEADRARAMGVLSEALADPDRTRDVIAALDQGSKASELSPDIPLVRGARFTPVSRSLHEAEVDVWQLDDLPSTGRVLNALRGDRAGTERGDPALHSARGPQVKSGGTVVASGTFLQHDKADWLATRHAAVHTFIWQASKALPDWQPSLFTRISEALKGEVSESSWHTLENGVDVELRHGARRWHVVLLFIDTAVTVRVAKDHEPVLEREVARTMPEAFSRTLLQALDGDVRSTHLALEAAHKAMTVETRAMH
ncbi:hypothetical protein WI77_27000 [Burkholderia ubonensis]|nr:hypothetical protein WI77_27000 [Burkholderia ubonensis]